MLGIPAKLPTENSPIYSSKTGKLVTPTGVYIGMLEYGGPSHPFTDPDAWDCARSNGHLSPNGLQTVSSLEGVQESGIDADVAVKRAMAQRGGKK
jgi:hypothetical protein